MHVVVQGTSILVNTKFCQGLSDISDSYAGFIIDQWGVLHDGEHVYDGVFDCLKELQARKKFRDYPLEFWQAGRE